MILFKEGSYRYREISGGTEGGLDDKEAGNGELAGSILKSVETFQSLEPAL